MSEPGSGDSPREQRHGLVRDLTGFDLTEGFLFAAVTAVLAIRGFLALTGYPQVGGSGLHVSHMLWGGLGMLTALLLLLLFVGSRVRTAAAWIGGVGFGTFIDEVGKFLTDDNDYFFRPAVALIYAVFVGVFLFVRYLIQRRAPSRAARLSYAYGALTDLAAGRLGDRRRRRALDLLGEDDDHGGEDDDRVLREVRALLERAPSPVQPPSRWTRLTRLARALVDRLRGLAGHPLARRAAIGLYFLLVAGILVATIVGFVRRGDPTPPLNALTIGSAATVVAVAVCSLIGVTKLVRGKRPEALRFFHAATLVMLLVGQFVAFVAVQFLALVSLALTLLVLGALRAELRVENNEGPSG